MTALNWNRVAAMKECCWMSEQSANGEAGCNWMIGECNEQVNYWFCYISAIHGWVIHSSNPIPIQEIGLNWFVELPAIEFMPKYYYNSIIVHQKWINNWL